MKNGVISHAVVHPLLIIELKLEVAVSLIREVKASNAAWVEINAGAACPPMVRHLHPETHQRLRPFLVDDNGLGMDRRHVEKEKDEEDREGAHHLPRLWPKLWHVGRYFLWENSRTNAPL